MLDASAVLAGILGETGHDRLNALMQETDRTCIITTVNASEVLAKLIDLGFTDKQASEALDALALSYMPVDLLLARKAASIRSQTKAIGCSLGDRVCLAGALIVDATTITADRSWKKLTIAGLKVVYLR